MKSTRNLWIALAILTVIGGVAIAAGATHANACPNCPAKADGGCPHAAKGDCPHAAKGDCPNAKGDCPHAEKGDCPHDKKGEGCPYAKNGQPCPNHMKGDADTPSKEDSWKAGYDEPKKVGETVTCPMCSGGHEFEVKEKTQHIALDGKHFYFCSTKCALAFKALYGGDIDTAGAQKI